MSRDLQSLRPTLPAGPLQTTWGEPPASTAAPLTEPKPTKVKTRPSEPPTFITDEIACDAETISSPASSQASSILVSSTSLTLFECMFTANSSNLSDIYWTDFVSAMVDAGCSVMPGGGSCFTFTHVDKDDKKRSMVFHRPHPEPTMSKERLKSFGSRLNRHWGWSEVTFAVEV
ncbi:hypothetical protein KCU77_g1452, partial [Aureobasidium melanogenum]